MSLLSRTATAAILALSLDSSGPQSQPLGAGALSTSPGTAQGEGTPRCERLRDEILRRAIDPIGSIDTAEQQRLMLLVRRAETLPGADPVETCAMTTLRELAASSSCGSAADLVTSTLGVDGVLTQDAMREALGHSNACTPAVVSGTTAEPRFERWLFDMIEDWSLKQTNSVRRSGGLVALGALTRLAREDGASDVVERSEADLVAQLRAAPAREVAQRIEAAGNAGCVACVPLLRPLLHSPSVAVRHAASGALRFVPDPAAAAIMCGVLDGDPSADVREQAAWALRWRHENPVVRVDCLVRSAARDLSPIVRIGAANALAALSKDISRARSALLELTDTEYDPRVREVALRTVTALPPEKATASNTAVRCNILGRRL